MCGVIASADSRGLEAGLAAIAHRGPDGQGVTRRAGVTLGHCRLAIQDPSPRSAQPFTWGPVTISYAGELFNAPAVRALVEAAAPGTTWQTTGDTEVLAAALAELPAGTALAALDGMFAVAWADERTPGALHAARDRMGEVPLHLHQGPPVMAASELKAFTAAGRPFRQGLVMDVPPGFRVTCHDGGFRAAEFARVRCRPREITLAEAAQGLAARLAAAAGRRAISDVPVCTLLSGGIDSAAIAVELRARIPDLTAYTAVLNPRSRDLRCAREAADAAGIRLVEVPVPVPDADDLSAVVGKLELSSKAQVEIGWACLALAERIRADGFRVTYSGEAADELFGSYGMAYHGIAAKGWNLYRLGMVTAQARRNFPRVNKAFMAHGVEARLPFCDPDVTGWALSLPQGAVAERGRPKAVMSAAYAGRLPASVLSRPKLAFQDGLGLKQAIAAQLPHPARFYAAEFRRTYG